MAQIIGAIMQFINDQITDAVTAVRRHGPMWVLLVVAVAIVGVLAFQQIPVLIFKNLQVINAVILAYFADRTLFRNTISVDETLENSSLGPARLIARALVALGVIAGLTIGV